MKFLFFILIFFLPFKIFSQGVVISENENDTLHQSAILQLISTSKGLLIPKLTTTDRDNIANPAEGLLIFNTTDSEYQYNGGDETTPNWISIGSSGSSLWFQGSNDDVYRIYGNVGIGVNNPNEKLTVEGGLSLKEIDDTPSVTENYGKIFVKSSDNNLSYIDGEGRETSLTPDFAIFEERQDSGINAGSSNNISWIKRSLNTVQYLKGNSINLNTTLNVITIDSGLYKVSASAPAYDVRWHQIRLRKTSGTPQTLLVGTSEYSDLTADNTQTRSLMEGVIYLTLNGNTIELQHRCNNENLDDGLGRAVGFGEPEVYAKITIIKLK